MRGKSSGFTLIEVLVSLVILGISLGLIIALFGGGLQSVRMTEEYSQAIQLAREKMTLGLSGMEGEAEEQSGALNDYQWERTIRPFRINEDLGEESVTGLYQVDVTVRWVAGLKEKTIVLQGLEMASLPGQ